MARRVLAALVRDEGGATVTEYAAIAALIIVGVIAVLVILGSKLRSVFVTVNSHLPASSG